jgi:Tol biopolymer transport system component
VTIQPGSRLGPYEIVASLGAGGMGEVWQALDPRIGRQVAVKVLHPTMSGSEDLVHRFEQEARTAGQLNHPNLIAVFDVGREGEVAYLVTELLEGDTLRARLAGGALPRQRAIEWAAGIASGLAAAHERGVVHRDLKPDNVFITKDNRVKILDFGLARLTNVGFSNSGGTDAPTDRHTDPGQVMGTVGYMSPEQVRAQPVDHRSDIFSFGAILYEMLTGVRAFHRGSSVETLNAILKEEPPETSASALSMHPGLERIVRHCLEKHPEARFQSARDLAFDLEQLSTASGTAPSPAGVAAKERRLLPMATVLGAIAIAAVAYWVGSRFSSISAAGLAQGPRSLSFTRVTELPGPELQPTLSPDGRMVVYASGISGNLDLYLMRVGGDRAIPLTTDPADDSQPSFSPDGERIAFRSEREGGGLFVMGATGESVRRVTNAGFDPAWSPDGKRLVYADEGVLDPYSRAADSALWTVEVGSGKASRLFAGDAVQPSWSPDGKRIAFWSNDGGQRDIKTISASGGAPVPVTHDAATDWSPRWSPDGKWLYLSSDRGGSMNLWRVAVDSETGKPLGDPQAITTGVRALGYPSFSSEGSRLAVMAYESSYEQTIYQIDPNAPTVARPVRTLRNPSASWCSLSRHGDWLACRTAGVPEDLVLVRADGGEIRRLTSDRAKDRNAVWDPMGERLLFMSTLSGVWATWSIRVDGSDRREITSKVLYSTGAWSADGRYYLTGDRTGLVKIDVSTGAEEKLGLDLGLGAGELVFVNSCTDKGNRVAVTVANRSGRATAYRILDLDSGSVRDLGVVPSGTGGDSGIGGWFPDGRHLVVKAAEGATVVDVDSGRRTVVAPAGRGLNDPVSLSRDGRFLLVEKEILDSDIWLIEMK